MHKSRRKKQLAKWKEKKRRKFQGKTLSKIISLQIFIFNFILLVCFKQSTLILYVIYNVCWCFRTVFSSHLHFFFMQSNTGTHTQRDVFLCSKSGMMKRMLLRFWNKSLWTKLAIYFSLWFFSSSLMHLFGSAYDF